MLQQLSKQKVLYVFGGEKASGAEIVIERLMAYNPEVEPHLFISPGQFSSDLIKAQKAYPIHIVDRLKKLNRSSTGALAYYKQAIKNYFSISAGVIKYAKKHRIKFIHANTIVPASYLIPAILYCRFFRLKKYFLWSDHDLQYYSKLDHVLSQACVNMYDKTLTVSDAVKNKYRNKTSVFTLYNGLDVKFFKPSQALREQFRIAHKLLDDALVFGIAGTISPRKCQLSLIEVLKKIQHKHGYVKLIIAGALSQDDQNYCERVLQAIEGDEHIQYLGAITDMVAFYNGCDVIVNNSSLKGGEPLGTTIYEAMACEKVVIATKTGGTPEIIDDGINGFVIEPENKKELQKIIEDLIEGRIETKIIEKNARLKVAEKFSIAGMAAKYNQLIFQQKKL